MNALIMCSGQITEYDKYTQCTREADVIICADGGAHHARQMAIIPDLIVGDMDSISAEDLEYFTKNMVQIEKFDTSKDRTDSEIAIDRALEMGAGRVIIMGALGAKRMDHAIANVFLLRKLADKKTSAAIVNDDCVIEAIVEKCDIEAGQWANISLLPLSDEVVGVYTQGLRYELNGENLKLGTSRGVSNRFVNPIASISIRGGVLLAIMT